MYPLIRLLTISITALRSGKMLPETACESTFRCMPWDLDMFREMNNGRVLTLYDLGRFDLSIRTGLAKALKNNRWGLVVAGSSIRYRRRIKVFDKVTMRTQIAGFEGSWTYIIQSMWVKGRPTSSVLLRTGVTSQGKVIDTDLVLNALGIAEWKPEPPDWVGSWIAAEAKRPWPP
ncbi:MAG: acyl-CoA thioesterase [Candidatus Thiodiazotropha sp. (ex Monitilora ramsayi)]|nr:acyl-CoA thioesterase [Candidatus Thiodiazotropha sp. (ex Monitilora ramsayi)]